MLTGDNGILTKAKEARDRTREENAKEIVQIEALGSYGIDGNINIGLLNTNLKTIKGITHDGKTLDENPITSLPTFVELDGFKIKIDSNGNVSIENKNSSEIEEIDPIYARLYNKNNSEEEVLVLTSKKDAFPDYSGELTLIKDMKNIKSPNYTYEDLFDFPELGDFLRSETWQQFQEEDPEAAQAYIDETIYELNLGRKIPWMTDSGTASDPYYSYCNFNLTEVRILDEIKPNSMYGWFQQTGLKKIDGIENINTSNLTSIDQMFAMCEDLTELDLSSFDTSNVTDMSGMFEACESLTKLDVSNFDTSNVTYMNGMFSHCGQLTELDLSRFNTSNVTKMSFMFSNCENLTKLNVNSFDTSKVNQMQSMFWSCKNLTKLDIRNFNISNVKWMYGMFKDSTNLTEILVGSNWKIVEGADTKDMFLNCGVSEVTTSTP